MSSVHPSARNWDLNMWNQDNAAKDASYGYGPLVKECERRGIGRSQAFIYAKKGLLETFQLGRIRMVYISSLETLPQRVPAIAANDAHARRRGSMQR